MNYQWINGGAICGSLHEFLALVMARLKAMGM